MFLDTVHFCMGGCCGLPFIYELILFLVHTILFISASDLLLKFTSERRRSVLSLVNHSTEQQLAVPL